MIAHAIRIGCENILVVFSKYFGQPLTKIPEAHIYQYIVDFTKFESDLGCMYFKNIYLKLGQNIYLAGSRKLWEQNQYAIAPHL